MECITVEPTGPYVAIGTEGKALANGKKKGVTEQAILTAEALARRGEDVKVVFLDKKGREVRMIPFYADRYEQEAQLNLNERAE